MNFLKKLFAKKESPIHSYADFWNWFLTKEQQFYTLIQEQGDLEEGLFVPLSDKLGELREGFYFLVGMCAENQAELVFTADGRIKNIVFVEELVAAAPSLPNWKFTALKQPMPIEQSSIKIGSYQFDESTLKFYSIDHPNMPDEIDLVITHQDWKKGDKNLLTNGIFLAIDNYLGELNAITTIDNLTIVAPEEATEKLIPIEKLKDFLIWREKEFVEKYKGLRKNTEEGNYWSAEATLPNGKPLFAFVNADLLQWDSQASHPWMTLVKLHYDGEDHNGMPDKPTYELLNEIEDVILEELKDEDGYLNVGRQTADSIREIYFYCVDFRKPSKVLEKVQKSYQDHIKMTFDIYRDKYWQSMQRFRPH